MACQVFAVGNTHWAPAPVRGPVANCVSLGPSADAAGLTRRVLEGTSTQPSSSSVAVSTWLGFEQRSSKGEKTGGGLP